MSVFSQSAPARGYAIAFVSTTVWSTTAIFIGYLIEQFDMPPLTLAFWRDLFVAGGLLAALAVVARPLLRLKRQDLLFFVLYGLVLALFNAVWTVSVRLNGAAVATVLVYSSPAFTALIGWCLWGERPGLAQMGAILLSIIGCALISGAYDPAAWRLGPTNILLGLLGGVLFAVYSLFGKVATKRQVNPWTATLYSFAFAAGFLLLVQHPVSLLWLNHPPTAASYGVRDALLGWGLLVLLAVGPTVGGYGLYTVSLAYLPASTANLILTLEPALTALWAFLFLGERLTWVQLGGGGLVLMGVVFLRVGERLGGAKVVGSIKTPPT